MYAFQTNPYKTHFGMAFHRLKPRWGGYYVHIKPGDSFGVGFWDPNKEDLLRLRKEIEMDASELRTILNDSELPLGRFNGRGS